MLITGMLPQDKMDKVRGFPRALSTVAIFCL